jgi:hypothetical protein
MPPEGLGKVIGIIKNWGRLDRCPSLILSLRIKEKEQDGKSRKELQQYWS